MKNRKKFHILKFMCLVFCLCLLSASLLSCKGDSEDSESGENNNSISSLALAENGAALYTIITPQNAPKALGELAVEFYDTLYRGSGVQFDMTDDYVRDTAGLSEKKEILIGMTSREESTSVMSGLGYFDTAVKAVGNKIVVAAHTEEGLSEVLDTLAASLISFDKQAGNAVLTNSDYKTVSDKKALLDGDTSLEAYTVVYPEGNAALKTSAEELISQFRKSFGVTPKAVSDSTAETECEIVLGVTNRGVITAEELYDGVIKVSGKKIFIAGGKEYFADLAVNYFADKYVSSGFSDRFNIAADLDTAFELDGDSVFSENADIRVMTYNVLSKELSPDKAAFGERRVLVSATIRNYLPDVIGVQEVDEGAYTMLAEDLGDTYAFGDTEVSEGKSYTSLMYNKNTVRLIECENEQYSVGQKRIRLVSWGYFEHIKTGEKFLVASMHWNVTNTQGERQAHSKESVEIINKLRKDFDCPVITTGDFNCNEGDSFYSGYLRDTKQTEAAFTAEVKGYSEKNIIDHITYTSDVKAVFFKLLKTDLTAVASDHNPSFADFKLN